MRTRAPQQFTVLGQPFRVRFHTRIKHKKHGELNGLTRCDEGKVDLSTHPADAKRVETYLHELIHCILGTASLPKDCTEEQFVASFAPLMLHTLRENPDVVGYLMKGDRA